MTDIGFARIYVAPELLVQALQMPADTKILQAYLKDGKIIITVSAAGLPDCKFDAEPMLIEPIIHKIVSQHGLWYAESYEWDWNVPK